MLVLVLAASALSANQTTGVDGVDGVDGEDVETSATKQLREAGDVYSWGADSFGQLGLGVTGDSEVPSRIKWDQRASSISSGGCHTLALTGRMEVHAFGCNDWGQLGTGDVQGRRNPAPLSELPPIASLRAGRAHSLALSHDGTVFGWGRNDRGAVGINRGALDYRVTERDRQAAATRHPPPPSGVRAEQTVDGEWHVVTVSASGVRVGVVAAPTRLHIDEAVAVVAAGACHSLAVTRSGWVYSWGCNTHGQLGLGGSVPQQQTPKRVVGELESRVVMQVVAGAQYSLGLTADMQLYSWGANGAGQLGLNSTVDQHLPRLITATDGGNLAALLIAAGGQHTIAVTLAQQVYVWGANAHGQLGLGDKVDRLMPTQAAWGNEIGVLSVAAGANHSLVLTGAGAVLGCGWSAASELGSTHHRDVALPLAVDGALFGSQDVLQLAAGEAQSFAIVRAADAPPRIRGASRFHVMPIALAAAGALLAVACWCGRDVVKSRMLMFSTVSYSHLQEAQMSNLAQQDAASLGAQEQRSLEALAAALDNEVELTDVTLDSEEHCGEA